MRETGNDGAGATKRGSMVDRRPRPRWARLLAASVLLVPLASGMTMAAAAATNGTCSFSDGPSFRACASDPQSKRLVLTKDMTCTAAEDCCPAGQAMMSLDSVAGRIIDGGGHVIHRTASQRACQVIALKHANGITIQNLTLDEDVGAPPCELSDHQCASTIEITGSQNIHIDRTQIFGGKGYVVKVWATDGFVFSQSTIVGAGIIGLYVGHYKFGPSHNIAITDSTFVHSRTNGVVLQGAYASDKGSPNLIAHNIFFDNHWHGLWPIPDGVTTGGQILIFDGDTIHVTGNLIVGHPCENCARNRHVSAVEIGDRAPPPAGVTNLSIDHNAALGYGEWGAVFYENPNTAVSGIAIKANSTVGYDALYGGMNGVNEASNAFDVSRPAAPATAGGLSQYPRIGSTVPSLLCAQANNRAAPTVVHSLEACANGTIVALTGFGKN